VCLLITLAAALVVSLVWYGQGRGGKSRLATLTLALMYWGAALMWMVDGFFRFAKGEPVLDLSRDDALLGLLVVAAGLVMYPILRRRNDPVQTDLP
jgi:hypothetical protein